MMHDMSNNTSKMTNTELRKCISKYRNDEGVVQAALEILLSRRNPANRHPHPLELQNPEAELEAIFREKLNQLEF